MSTRTPRHPEGRWPQVSPVGPVRVTCVTALLATSLAAQETRLFRLDSFDQELLFQFEHEDEELGQNGDRLREKEFEFREGLGLSTRGSIYHPKLFRFSLDADLQLVQSRLESSGETPTRDFDGLHSYFDYTGLLFRDHPISVETFALRSEQRNRQRFFPTTEIVREQVGVETWFKELRLPTSVLVDHERLQGRGFDTTDQTQDRLRIQSQRTERDWSLRGRYEWSRLHYANLGTDFRVSDASVFGLRRFGDRDQHIVHGDLRAREQSGSLDITSLGASSGLSWEFYEDLKSDSTLNLTRNTAASSDVDSARLSSALTHTLYRNLTSTLAVRGGRVDAEAFEQSSAAVLGALRYRRSLPFGGLELSAQHEHEEIRERSGGTSVLVVDELHVFEIGLPVILDNLAADPLSVIVTDFSGTVVYVEGVDYVVEEIGAQLHLSLPLGSLIQFGDTVRIDYRFDPQPSRDFVDRTSSYSGSIDLDRWARLSVGYDVGRQTLRDGIDDGSLNDSRRRTAHLQAFHYGGRASVDWQDSDTDQFSFQRTHYSTGYEYAFSEALLASIDVDLVRTRFDDGSPVEESRSALGRADYRLTVNTSCSALAEWRQTDLRTDEGHGFFVEARYLVRKVKFDAEFRLRRYRESFEVARDRQGTHFFLSLTRRF